MSFLFKKKVLEVQAPKEVKHADGRELASPAEQKSIRIGLIVGHTKKDPGARLLGKPEHEYDYNSDVADLAKVYALGLPNAVVEIIYRDNVGIAGAYKKAHDLGCDCVIELHFNDYTGSVRGSETLCTFDNTDVDFAHVIHKQVCQVFERDGMSRGVKPVSRSARGAQNLYSFPEGVNCLVEPFFGDNQEDVLLAQRKMEDYAKALVDACLLWAKKKDLI